MKQLSIPNDADELRVYLDDVLKDKKPELSDEQRKEIIETIVNFNGGIDVHAFMRGHLGDEEYESRRSK